MELFTVFDLKTGRILRSGYCPPGGRSLQPREGEGVFDGTADAATHYVDIDTLSLVPKGDRPDPWHVWDYSRKAWADPRKLANHQAARWSAIKARRDALATAPLATEWGTFDADEPSQLRIDRACRTSFGGELIRWTLHDNTVAELPCAALYQVNKLLADRTQRLRDIATELRTQIDAASTPDQVAAVTWPEDLNT